MAAARGLAGALAAVLCGLLVGWQPAPPAHAATGASVYVIYYLFWTPQHWHDKLGSSYPYNAQPLPLPGTIDASGCNPQVSYPGAQIVDLPAEGLYDQRQASTFDRHIAQAAAAGIRGFVVSWQGTGSTTQSPSSPGYDPRLDLLVSRVDAYDQAHPGAFSLALGLDPYGNHDRPADQMTDDLTYFAGRYGSNPAFRNPYSSKPMVMLLESRFLPAATVAAVSRATRSRLYLVGDETYATWSRDASYLDASGWYWSSENPWTNPGAGKQVASLASQVRAQGKRWFAPFTAGFDRQLQGRSCVPRNGTQTLQKVWQVNAASQPDAWFGISWNELVENTELEPTVRYGTAYLDTLKGLVGGGAPSRL